MNTPNTARDKHSHGEGRRVENVRCPGCRSPERISYYANCPDLLHGLPGVWHLMECAACGLVYTYPLPAPDTSLSYYPRNYSPYVSVKELRATVYGKLLRALLTLPYQLRFGALDWTVAPFGEGRMCDIGCGRGILLSRMRAHGWQCWGIDMSSIAVARAKSMVPDAEVAIACLEDIPWDTSFDLITMMHVLEHLADPIDALHRLHSLLTPGGKLFISLPNLASLEAKLFGRRWVGLDIPRHCIHFREHVIRACLEQNGFSIVSIRPAFFASSVSESLLLLLPARVRHHVLHSRIARYVYLLTVPWASLSYALGNRGVLEIVAEKKTTTGGHLSSHQSSV